MPMKKTVFTSFTVLRKFRLQIINKNPKIVALRTRNSGIISYRNRDASPKIKDIEERKKPEVKRKVIRWVTFIIPT